MADQGYGSRLKQSLEELKLDLPYRISILGKDVIGEVKHEAGQRDLVVVPTTGSQRRFRWSLGPIPERLADALCGSVLVIRYKKSAGENGANALGCEDTPDT